MRGLAYPPPYQKPPLSCFQPTGVNEESKEGSPYKGIRAWIALSPWTGDCIRVSSISAVKVTNLGDQVELGWSLGYAQANIGLGYDYFYSPELFEAWTPLDCARPFDRFPAGNSHARLSLAGSLHVGHEHGPVTPFLLGRRETGRSEAR